MKLVPKQTITGSKAAAKTGRGAPRVVLLGAAVVMTALFATRVTAQAEPKVVALTAGSCATVTEGDTVTFDWNPVFTPSADVKGLAEFGLGFARAVPEDHMRGISAPLKLEAHARVHSEIAEGSAITGESNGFYHIRFRIHSQQLPAGTYELVEAAATAMVDGTAEGARPQMTNSPLQSHFCLVVTAAPARRGR